MEIKEIWMDVVGYKNLYQVSNIGRVKRLKGNRCLSDRVLKHSSVGDGYCRVALCKNGNPKTRFVHRLVAIAFIPNPKNKATVNHIDSNRLNNRINNLEWMTMTENSNHGFLFGNKRRGEDEHNSKLTNKEVLEIRTSKLNQSELSRKYKVCCATISRIVKRESWKHI